jgi:hypothetical protein
MAATEETSETTNTLSATRNKPLDPAPFTVLQTADRAYLLLYRATLVTKFTIVPRQGQL